MSKPQPIINDAASSLVARDFAKCIDDDGASDDDLSDIETTVDLGFLITDFHPHKLSRPYFPSKCGGRPVWLGVRGLPVTVCGGCGGPMSFLAQIYAPIRNDNDNDSETFHRTLYVFACHQSTCLSQHTEASPSMVCYRSQLPRVNRFYSERPPPKLTKKTKEKIVPEVVVGDGVRLCARCSGVAGAQCQGYESVQYCSEVCATIDRQLGYIDIDDSKADNDDASLWQSRGRSLLPEFELVIETEYIPPTTADDHSKENELLQRYQQRQQQAEENKEDDVEDDDGGDDDDDFGLSALGPLHRRDAAFTAFRKRIAHNPEQVLRYERDGQPLWVSDDKQCSDSEVAACSHCGGPRHFEFQLLPQLLYYFADSDGGNEHHHAKEMEWGTIAVYTCANSCGDGQSNYFREFAFVQNHSELLMVEQDDDGEGAEGEDVSS